MKPNQTTNQPTRNYFWQIIFVGIKYKVFYSHFGKLWVWGSATWGSVGMSCWCCYEQDTQHAVWWETFAGMCASIGCREKGTVRLGQGMSRELRKCFLITKKPIFSGMRELYFLSEAAWEIVIFAVICFDFVFILFFIFSCYCFFWGVVFLISYLIPSDPLSLKPLFFKFPLLAD